MFHYVVFHSCDDALILSVGIDINFNPPSPTLPLVCYSTSYKMTLATPYLLLNFLLILVILAGYYP